MKRDMDLVRKILFALEEHLHGFYCQNVLIEGYSSEVIGYHVTLMAEAGLIEAANMTHMGSKSPEAIPKRLTWEGHEFLEACRDPGRWAKAKEVVGEMGSSVSFDVLKSVLVQLMMSQIPKLIGSGV